MSTAIDIQRRFEELRSGDAEIASALSDMHERFASWLSEMQGVDELLRRALGDKERRGRAPLLSGRERLLTSAAPGMVEAPEPPAPAPADADESAAGNDEDEALLATLDVQIAERIRVKRRLSGNRRPVRELLAELEAEATTDSTPQKKQRKGRRS